MPSSRDCDRHVLLEVGWVARAETSSTTGRRSATIRDVNPLALFDLDNTLIDRESAFRRWAQDFCQARNLPEGSVERLVRGTPLDQLDGSSPLGADPRRHRPGRSEPVPGHSACRPSFRQSADQAA